MDVVDVATGSVGGLSVPDGYQRTDTSSAGIQQLVFSGQGPLAVPAARRAVASCTPRDTIAGDVGVPVSNARLNPANDDAFGAAEDAAANNLYVAANADAARAALNNTPLTVRIGYQAPNARLNAVVSAIAKACAPAGITVQDVSSEPTGPQTLQANEIDALLASTGGATGSGSSGSSAIDAFDLHTGNGNNLSGYSNPQVDGIIDKLAATSDPKEVARLLGDGASVLWNDMPTLPLYRQQRMLVSSKKMSAVSRQPDPLGRGLEHGPMGAEGMSDTSGDQTRIVEVIASLIREVPDFPSPGVLFKDLTPLLADPDGLAAVTDALSELASGAELVAGIDARGFLLGAAVATRLGTGVLAIRKGGKLPPPVLSETYTLEYGTATLEIPADGVELAGRNVVIIDDVLATGGTLAAAARLLDDAGAAVTSAAVVLELAELRGRDAVAPLPVSSLYQV